MSDTPKDKLTIADLVEAQRDTSQQLRLLNEKLKSIDESSKALATTDSKAVHPVLDVFFFVVFLIAGIATLNLVAIELAFVVYIGMRLLYRTPALTRSKEMQAEEREVEFTREQDAKEWNRLFGRKKNKQLTPPSA